MELERKEFESELGDVTVGLESIFRARKRSEEWERIAETFSEDIMIDQASFADLEDLDFEQDPVFPCIEIKTGGEWGKMFFTKQDDAERCFKRLVYNWASYEQNH